jgi:hypothetical protein
MSIHPWIQIEVAQQLHDERLARAERRRLAGRPGRTLRFALRFGVRSRRRDGLAACAESSTG